jgi:hypothetical protein
MRPAKKAGRASFVKAATTTTTPATSKAELDRILRRYGASSVAVSEMMADRRIVVEFTAPSSATDATIVPVRLECDIRRVYDALFGQPKMYDHSSREWVQDHDGYHVARLDRAERVAWRNLLLWVDAALSAAAINLQTLGEAFFAHLLVPDENGRRVRMIQAVIGSADLGPRLLGSGS